MDFLKPPFVLLTAPLSIGLEKGMQFQSFKWLSGQPGWGLDWTQAVGEEEERVSGLARRSAPGLDSEAFLLTGE